MKPPVIRYFSLPNGSKIMSLRESTLRAGLKAASTALKTERWSNAMTDPLDVTKVSNLSRFDAAEYLDSSEARAEYLRAAMETEDVAFIMDAIGVVARAMGMSQVTKEAGAVLAEMVRIDQEAGLYDPPGSEEMRNHINAQAVLLAEVLRDGTLPATLRQKVWNAVNGEPTPPSPSEP